MNSKPFKVFIQSNNKQHLGALVSKFSLLSNSRSPEQFEVEIMSVESLPEMMKFQGAQYWVKGRLEKWSKDDLQSFTMTRFLPPELMGYQGRAVVIDPDVFATEGTDVMDLFEMDMRGKSILACLAGEGKFKTSVMVLDCSRLKHWKWKESLDAVFTGKRDYRQWMSLELEPKDSIGILPPQWNHYDELSPQTRFIHFTRRLTQPWKTGLDIDFKYDIAGSRLGFLPNGVLRTVRKILKRGKEEHTAYLENPDQQQVQFFFGLVKKALGSGFISAQVIQENIDQKYVRNDIWNFIKS